MTGGNAMAEADIIDTQSVNSTEFRSDDRGHGARKKRRGREQLIAVATLGLLQREAVHPAGTQDSSRASRVFRLIFLIFRRLSIVFSNPAYSRMKRPAWHGNVLASALQPVGGDIGTRGFVIMPKRYIVEQSIDRIGPDFRNSTDYKGSLHVIATCDPVLSRSPSCSITPKKTQATFGRRTSAIPRWGALRSIVLKKIDLIQPDCQTRVCKLCFRKWPDA